MKSKTTEEASKETDICDDYFNQVKTMFEERASFNLPKDQENLQLDLVYRIPEKVNQMVSSGQSDSNRVFRAFLFYLGMRLVEKDLDKEKLQKSFQQLNQTILNLPATESLNELARFVEKYGKLIDISFMKQFLVNIEHFFKITEKLKHDCEVLRNEVLFH